MKIQLNDVNLNVGDNMYKLPFTIDFNDIDTLLILSRANNKIGELKGMIKLLPNPTILLNAMILGEAKDSSEIENIITTYDELFKEMASNTQESIAAKEVLQYRQGVNLGFSILKEKGFISINSIIDIHHCIAPNKGGIRKLPGTVIKNTITNEIVHTPPQTENEVIDFLSNFEKYMNKADEPYDPLIEMAILHYQFESIHPFYDGNGRCGRILNVLYLVMKEKIDYPILYLSKYIIKNKEEYYVLLKKCNENEENIREFVRYLLRGIEETANFTIHFINEIVSSMENTTMRLKLKLPKLYSSDLVDFLYFEFYTKNEYFRQKIGCSRDTATKHLKMLEKEGFLSSEKIGKEVVYKNKALFELVSKW